MLADQKTKQQSLMKLDAGIARIYIDQEAEGVSPGNFSKLKEGAKVSKDSIE